MRQECYKHRLMPVMLGSRCLCLSGPENECYDNHRGQNFNLHFCPSFFCSSTDGDEIRRVLILTTENKQLQV